MIDLQDKAAWCEKGAEDEAYFLEHVAPAYNLPLIVHPGKSTDKYETDFQTIDRKTDVDLKHVTTPFYTAGQYDCDPDFTVTFNHKDYIRYRYKYPESGDRALIIMFWCHWEWGNEYQTVVAPIRGIWSVTIATVDGWIRAREIPCHSYQQRQGECGSNAKHSWLIDLRRLKEHAPAG